MSNIDIKLNLMKFENAFVTKLQGRSGEKNCVCIPVADNDIFLSTDQSTGKVKGAYVDLTAWERQSLGQYGDTHNIKQSFSREYRERVGSEALKQKPYLGNGKVRNGERTQATPVRTQDVGNADMPY